MFLELPNGKTVNLSEDEVERYLALPDDDINDFLWRLVEKDRGSNIRNPFSVSYAGKSDPDDDYECEECLDEDELLRAKEEFEKDLFNGLDFEE